MQWCYWISPCNGQLLVSVYHNQLWIMASETADKIEWKLPTLMGSTHWAPRAQYKYVQPVPEIDSATFCMWGNHIAYMRPLGVLRGTYQSSHPNDRDYSLVISLSKSVLLEKLLLLSFVTSLSKSVLWEKLPLLSLVTSLSKSVLWEK